MPTAPRLDDQLCFALYTASRLVTRAYRPLLLELGLTYPQYLTMLVLWEGRDLGEGAPSVKELGARLHLDSGTLTPLLKRMEAVDLVVRARDTQDERTVRVSLTDRGSSLSSGPRPCPRSCCVTQARKSSLPSASCATPCRDSSPA